MYILISILIFIICLLLVLIVLVQNPKGGGLSSEFSSANQIGGVQKTADFLEKATWTLAIALLALSLVSAAFIGTTPQERGNKSATEEILEDQMNNPVPAQPGQKIPKPSGGGQGQKAAPSQGQGGASPSGGNPKEQGQKEQ